ncbi:hypothetical protein DMUE_1308 [Dictyocoela muelleri]|nr:hypothetical protein DMUE_1308 [Dictyocoela muelleri]
MTLITLVFSGNDELRQYHNEELILNLSIIKTHKDYQNYTHQALIQQNENNQNNHENSILNLSSRNTHQAIIQQNENNQNNHENSILNLSIRNTHQDYQHCKNQAVIQQNENNQNNQQNPNLSSNFYVDNILASEKEITFPNKYNFFNNTYRYLITGNKYLDNHNIFTNPDIQQNSNFVISNQISLIENSLFYLKKYCIKKLKSNQRARMNNLSKIISMN